MTKFKANSNHKLRRCSISVIKVIKVILLFTQLKQAAWSALQEPNVYSKSYYVKFHFFHHAQQLHIHNVV